MRRRHFQGVRRIPISGWDGNKAKNAGWYSGKSREGGPRAVKSSQEASARWKRVCELALHLLDSPRSEWDSILDRECEADSALRAQVLAVCENYSESDEFFGAVADPPLLFEEPLNG